MKPEATSEPFNDWAPGDKTPAWEPVAGGKGWGKPSASGGNPAAARGKS